LGQFKRDFPHHADKIVFGNALRVLNAAWYGV
jgi:hypothetical protein